LPSQITALEQKYRIALPRSYSLFLSQMGHAHGKLGNLGEFDLCYDDPLDLTEEELELWRHCSVESPNYNPPAFPRNGLIFCARLGNPDYWLLLCEGQDDSPVIHFNYDTRP